MTYLYIFTLHLNPLIQIILMNPRAQTVYQEKAVPLPNLDLSTRYWVRIREKHHQCHTKEERGDGFQPLTKRGKIWSLKKSKINRDF